MKASTKSKHNYWMVKQEPETYSWDDFVRDGGTDWSGVRNYQARNNLRSMKPGDKVLFYHSGKGKEVVGLAEVTKAAYPDPTVDDEQWAKLRADLRTQYATVQADIEARRDWSDSVFLTGTMALVPHAAYHLGAIRQMIRVVKQS